MMKISVTRHIKDIKLNSVILIDLSLCLTLKLNKLDLSLKEIALFTAFRFHAHNTDVYFFSPQRLFKAKLDYDDILRDESKHP